MNQILKTLLAIFVVALVSGCTYTHNIDIKPDLTALPKVNKTNVRAGVYYSPQFVNEKVTHVSGEHIWVAPIGAASVPYFDDVFSRVFTANTRIVRLDSDEINNKDIDVVIAPTLEQLDFKLQSFQADKDWYRTSYRITLYNKQAVPVASWIVSGQNVIRGLQGYGGMIENGMIDAAIMFLQGFGKAAGPALLAISNSQNGPASTIDSKNITLSASRAVPPGFDAKKMDLLRDAGVVTVKITVHSNSEQLLIVRQSDMRLNLADNQIIEPSSISLILGNLETTSHAIVGAAFFGPLAMLPTVGTQVTSNAANREAGMNAASAYLFQEKALTKGKDVTGIVFFTLPKGVKENSIQSLSAWIVDPANATGVQSEISLPTQKVSCDKTDTAC